MKKETIKTIKFLIQVIGLLIVALLVAKLRTIN